jgi:hypothetical protein
MIESGEPGEKGTTGKAAQKALHLGLALEHSGSCSSSHSELQN